MQTKPLGVSRFPSESPPTIEDCSSDFLTKRLPQLSERAEERGQSDLIGNERLKMQAGIIFRRITGCHSSGGLTSSLGQTGKLASNPLIFCVSLHNTFPIASY
jgi:hypothetical protein